MAEDLTRWLAEYWQRGFAVLQGVFNPEQCARLIAAAHDLPAARQGEFGPAMQPHRQNQMFHAAMARRAIVERVGYLVGGPAVGLQTTFYYSPPGTPGFARHQDSFFVEPPPHHFVSAWIALTDVNQHNGCLVAWVNSHRSGRATVQPAAKQQDPRQDPNASNEQADLPPGCASMAIEVPAGAVVFLHGDCIHKSLPNTSSQLRYALLCTYIRAGSRFRPGERARRCEIAL